MQWSNNNQCSFDNKLQDIQDTNYDFKNLPWEQFEKIGLKYKDQHPKTMSTDDVVSDL